MALGLLPVMVNNLQSELQALSVGFLLGKKAKGKAMKRSVKESAKVKTPNPRMEMPYTYLMAWLVMHCPSLMTAVNYC